MYHEDFSAVHLFLKKNNLFFWLCWVFIVARGFSLVVASRGHSLVVVQGLLTAVASLVGVTKVIEEPVSQRTFFVSVLKFEMKQTGFKIVINDPQK